MPNYAQYAGFLSVMILMSLLPSWYILTHIVSFFGLDLGYFFWVCVIVIGLLFIASMGIAMMSDDPRMRGLNIGLGIWVGFFFILLFLLIFLDIVGLFYDYRNYTMVGVIVLSVSAIAAAAGAINARYVRIKRVKVPAKGLKRSIKIVQMSDLHLGPVNGLDYFDSLVKRTNKEKPDLVLITGDLIDGRLSDEAFSPINKLKAPVYFSVGNHEHYVGIEEILGFLGRTKAVALINEKVELDDIELAGIDFEWNAKAFDGMIDKVRPSGKKYAILMSHGPPAFDAARKAGFDLTLSGHTHGGQFWPFTMFGRLFIKYRVGTYERDGKHLFVTSGTGTWGPPIRLGVNSELAVIEVG